MFHLSLFLLSLTLNTLHNTLDNYQSRLFIRLWRPEVFVLKDDVFYQKESVDNFIKCRIFLEENDTFSLASFYENELSLFLCNKNGAEHIIYHSLWTSEQNQDAIWESLEVWHSKTFPNITLIKNGV